jgi:hypothetical protein
MLHGFEEKMDPLQQVKVKVKENGVNFMKGGYFMREIDSIERDARGWMEKILPQKNVL